MSDSLTILGVVDDFGPEQGLLTANQMTDDTTPTVRVSLTTGSGATIGAGDTVKIGDMGSDAAQAVVTADDVARGYIDVAAHYVKAKREGERPGPVGRRLRHRRDPARQRRPDDQPSARRGDADRHGRRRPHRQLRLLERDSFLYGLHPALRRRGPHGRPGIQRQLREGVDQPLTITPLANGNYVALFLNGDHYVRLADDGSGGAWLYFDRDGSGTADPWGTFITYIDHVSPAQLKATDFIFH